MSDQSGSRAKVWIARLGPQLREPLRSDFVSTMETIDDQQRADDFRVEVKGGHVRFTVKARRGVRPKDLSGPEDLPDIPF